MTFHPSINITDCKLIPVWTLYWRSSARNCFYQQLYVITKSEGTSANKITFLLYFPSCYTSRVRASYTNQHPCQQLKEEEIKTLANMKLANF